MTKMKKPKLPEFLERKIYKTGQTRGADDDVIYQNRVSRNNTVLIPLRHWQNNEALRNNNSQFEKGFIVYISPKDYFQAENSKEYLDRYGLTLGTNSFIYYETREDWDKYPPEKLGWTCANSRFAPLGGNYVARVPANTSADAARSQRINLGFNTKNSKGAGIRMYEYASPSTNKECRLQLEALFFLCSDSIETLAKNGMTFEDAKLKKDLTFEECNELALLDYDRLRQIRAINDQNQTICPLCLKTLSSEMFFRRLALPVGREVPDSTVTQVNVFHIEELNFETLNHRKYNLGWGHHHCNVVVKDSGIYKTLGWMKQVLDANTKNGYILE